MKRFILQQLIEWKNREDRKPLILNGARQVGKTWLLHEFAKLEYKKEAYVVCRKNNLARQLFSQDFNVDRILRGLRAMTSVDITPGDTLIILDEIQDIPEALESLKYFKEEVPEYHIAVAGSLLGISLHQDVSYPVGKVNVINIFPMNFEEFLVAKGEEEACKLLMSGDFETISLLHDKYTDLLRQYYYVGGMPEVVLKYVETDSLLEVRRIQSEILQGYDLDFSKHAPKEQVPRVRMVWNSIPSQLFKENKKLTHQTGRLPYKPLSKSLPQAARYLTMGYSSCQGHCIPNSQEYKHLKSDRHTAALHRLTAESEPDRLLRLKVLLPRSPD